MELVWLEKSWEEYCIWQTQDNKIVKRINAIIKDILRKPYEGIAKPEPLKFSLSGYWSRRIDAVNRIVYGVKGERIIIVSCKGHYD